MYVLGEERTVLAVGPISHELLEDLWVSEAGRVGCCCDVAHLAQILPLSSLPNALWDDERYLL